MLTVASSYKTPLFTYVFYVDFAKFVFQEVKNFNNHSNGHFFLFVEPLIPSQYDGSCGGI